VTHDVELAAQAADRVVILSHGEVIADDAPQALTVSPVFAPEVARRPLFIAPSPAIFASHR